MVESVWSKWWNPDKRWHVKAIVGMRVAIAFEAFESADLCNLSVDPAAPSIVLVY